MQSPHERGNRKRYDQPVLRKLRSEQAKLFLVGYAYIGHHGAKEILEVLFPVPSPTSVVEQRDPRRMGKEELGGLSEYEEAVERVRNAERLENDTHP